MFLPGLILNRNAEAKFLRFDGVFSLCFCKQAGLFGHLLRLCRLSQPLISPAQLVVGGGVAGIKLKHLLEFFPRPFPLLQLHVKKPQLEVRFDHGRPQLLGTLQRFQRLLLLTQLQRHQAKYILERKITRDDSARFRQYLERFLIISLFHVRLGQRDMPQSKRRMLRDCFAVQLTRLIPVPLHHRDGPQPDRQRVVIGNQGYAALDDAGRFGDNDPHRSAAGYSQGNDQD